MSTSRIPATGFADYLDEDQPALYVKGGAGNIPGVTEVHLSFYDPEDGKETLFGWFPRAAIEDALNRAGHSPIDSH
ncbi:hypothetical protein ACI7YT_12680 [Microbacterium sp. M]|uniref:hypothetical protein n=1 Tax=Microbacterium sp. M TaxID=3377125 RepID=UPI00386A80D1